MLAHGSIVRVGRGKDLVYSDRGKTVSVGGRYFHLSRIETAGFFFNLLLSK